MGARAVILSGGPDSVYDPGARLVDPAILESDLPILGICYGMQLFAHQMGGRVEMHTGRREYGPAEIHLTTDERAMGDGGERDPATLFAGVARVAPARLDEPRRQRRRPAARLRGLARSNSGALAAMGDARGHIGIQFHPEVTHTPQGAQIIENFLFRISGLPRQLDHGRLHRGDRRAHPPAGGRRGPRDLRPLRRGGFRRRRAAGPQGGWRPADLHLRRYGLLRAGEPEQVVETFRANLHIPLVAVDASERFLNRLAGVTDPERKRKIIGEEFVRVFEDEAVRLREDGEVRFLAQGTLYPDVIESASASDASAAQKIKTHHNVGGLPEGMAFELIEPLRYLFKDEARAVGGELGLPEEWVWRHPFPGPGLAIRVIGEVTRERLDTLRHADAIFIEELRRAGLYREIGQAFAVLTPVQSVGVMGDLRTYASMVALRAVTTGDFMTADWARLPYDVLGRVANRIVNEEPRVNRVVYDITSKPPATIEWE